MKQMKQNKDRFGLIVAAIMMLCLAIPVFAMAGTSDRTAQERAGSNHISTDDNAENGFSVYAIIGTVMEKNVLASDGYNYHITVTCGADSGIPEGAELEVNEVLPGENGDASESFVYGKSYEEYVAYTENALGLEEGSARYIRLFNIKIIDKDGEKVQPAKGSSVSVRIELADVEDGKDLSVVHFADGKEEGDVVDSSAENNENGAAVVFEADSFSVYSIVDAPEPASTEINTVTALEELTDGVGFYLSYGGTQVDKMYISSDLNKSSCFIEVNSFRSAAVWYFEADDSNYRIYTYVDGEKKYLANTSGDLVGLTDDKGVPFIISPSPEEGKFYFKHATAQKWLQHSNGGRGIRFYKDNNNAENSRIAITYASSYALDNDPYGLDGATFGIAYNDNSATAAGLTTQNNTVGNTQRLLGQDMLIRPDVLEHDGVLLVAQNVDIPFWTFHNDHEDKYTISTTVDGRDMYLVISGGSVTMTEDPEEASLITATPGTGASSGKWLFSVDGYSLNYTGNVNNGFNAVTGNGATAWMNLVEQSVLTEDDFNLYTAKKVSVSDTNQVYDGKQIVLYTRIWNDTTKKYEFYAVDHDGSLIRCYATGDNIEWIGTRVNTALWSFTEGTNTDGSLSYYYWLQNTQYGNYLVPQAASGKVSYVTTEEDFNASVNLNGRRYGENYTTIITWDGGQYAYSGLKTENGHVVPCPLSEAEDFYFAVVNPIDEEDKLTTVPTIDNNDYGITMKMIDFNNALMGSGDAARDSVQHQFFGAHGNGFEQGLLSTNLTGDYPTTTSKTGHEESLGNLFNTTTVNHLFIESIYNESGYFEYDSTQNFASLLDVNGDLTDTFTVYDQIGQVGVNASNNQGDFGPTRIHGQFMPYNNLVAGRYSTATNQTDVLAQELPDTDPRKGEKLYLIPKSEADYFFGMEVSASFTQTPSGLDAWGHDIIFEFSGDDDFWLYVDGELILDLGGVRAALTGSVNFRTGVVKSVSTTTSLYEVFRKNYQTRGLGTDEINAKLDEIFTQNENGQYVFKDYTNHDMRIFYMERGGGGSNLYMRFNLAAVKPGTFLLSKKLSGTELEDSSLIEFPYQIYYTTSDGESEPHLLGAVSGEENLVCYAGSTRTLNAAGMYQPSFTPFQGSHAYDHVFFLKPGETAEVTLPNGAVSYEVVECGVNPDIYDKVSANGTELAGVNTQNTVSGTVRRDYRTSKATLDERATVEYDNHVREGAMRTLSITKKLYDVNGTTELSYPENDTTFTFRLYLGDENASASALLPANLYSYYIKDANDNYCRWDTGTQKFVSLGVTTYEDLTKYFADNHWTDAQKESVIFKTSMNGSISRVPAGYTVEVRNLVISTRYKVEERDWEIPKGYSRREADGYVRTDTAPDIRQSAPYTGAIEREEDPKVQVRNQKGWGLTAEKNWTDKDFMASHDDIYIAVYVGDDFAQIPASTVPVYNEDGEIVSYNTIYKDCVRVLKHPETELYFFFGDLYNGASETAHNFSEYVIKEVQLTKKAADTVVETDADGYVTNLDAFDVTVIDDNASLAVGGTSTVGGQREENPYTVSYEVGESTGRNENIRIDTVTNSRPGIELYKTDWSGAWMTGDDGKTTLTGALAGARFTLKDSNNNNVAAASYTSASDGLITTAYLPDGTYTLAEILAPKGYVGLDRPITITVDGQNLTFTMPNGTGTDTLTMASDGTVTGSSNYFTVERRENTNMLATVIIKNRRNELKVVKVGASETGDTPQPLAGAHFALYRQVRDTNGFFRKDYQPVAGYNDLITDADGIPVQTVTAAAGTITHKITMDLPVGTYYLTETQPPEGYRTLSDDIIFSIGSDGTVAINSIGHSDWLSSVTDITAGTTSYTMSIPNNLQKDFTFHKIWLAPGDSMEKLAWQKDITVTLYKNTNTKVAKYVISMTQDGLTATATSEITGTEAPAIVINEAGNNDYSFTIKNLPDEDTFYFIESDLDMNLIRYGKLVGDDIEVTQGAERATSDTPYIINRDTGGYELPSTGGSGANFIYILGTILTAFAGAGLLLRRRWRT